MIYESKRKLSNGVEMPTVGLGVFRAGGGDATRNAVKAALDVGYRHVDTAAIYGNEEEVGDAIRAWCDANDASREDIFVTTKLWNDDQGYDSALRAFDASLERLGFDYIDQYLLHWPVPKQRLASWRALESLYADGRAKTIGVSNFMIDHLVELYDACEVLPHTNQFEIHPFLPQQEVIDWCRVNDVQTVAYSPLTKGRLLGDPRVVHIAERYGKSAAQVLIRWSIQKGHVVLPKSSNPGRIAENADVFDFALTVETMEHLDELAEDAHRTAWDPTRID